jgi:putative FmdB family regulatory protein
MPIYEFECRLCGRPFEELVFNIGRVREVRCPVCGSDEVKKKLSAVAARVAGTTASSGVASCSPGSL